MRKIFRPVNTYKTKKSKRVEYSWRTEFHLGQYQKMCSAVSSHAFTMGAYRARNKIRFVKTVGMIKGSSKDMTHYWLVNRVFKWEVAGSGSGNINWLSLSWAILPTLGGFSQIKLPIWISYSMLKNVKVIVNRVSIVLDNKNKGILKNKPKMFSSGT